MQRRGAIRDDTMAGARRIIIVASTHVHGHAYIASRASISAPDLGILSHR